MIMPSLAIAQSQGKAMSMIWTENHPSIAHSLSATSKRSLAKLRALNFQLSKLLHSLNLLQPVRQWLDHIEICDVKTAQFLSKAIPAQCPFERDIELFGHKIAHIPPLCKLNPLYEQLVGLRFRALCYLVDECGLDIQPYL